jgi:DNA-binding NarL/FixJ family response regulator
MNILIVDDHKIFREGFERALRLNSDVKSIYHAENGVEALSVIEENKPDVVFMDIQMKVMDGITATKTASKKYPSIKIIALSQFEDTYHAIKMFDSGASGYLMKTSGINEINKTINLVSQGEIYYAPEIIETMAQRTKKRTKIILENILSKRELEILYLVCCGKSDKIIADELFLSARTVEWHRRKILGKTETRSSAELINFAIDNGMYFP